MAGNLIFSPQKTTDAKVGVLVEVDSNQTELTRERGTAGVKRGRGESQVRIIRWGGRDQWASGEPHPCKVTGGTVEMEQETQQQPKFKKKIGSIAISWF